MKLNKMKKAELIDIILRKDEVEAKLREENKQLSEALDDAEDELNFEKNNAMNTNCDLQKQLGKVIADKQKLKSKVKRYKYTLVTTLALLVASVVIGFIL